MLKLVLLGQSRVRVVSGVSAVIRSLASSESVVEKVDVF